VTNPATIATLAGSSYLDAGDPIVLLRDSGTGKTHLLIGLGIAACEQARRVRCATCAQLVNELVPLPLPASRSRLYGPHSGRDLGASLDELIVNTTHDPRGVVSTSRLHGCAPGVVVGGSHSDR
jgi:hypothetical protein